MLYIGYKYKNHMIRTCMTYVSLCVYYYVSYTPFHARKITTTVEISLANAIGKNPWLSNLDFRLGSVTESDSKCCLR